MKNKSIQHSHMGSVLNKVFATTVFSLLTLGIYGCDNNMETSENVIPMEEPVNNSSGPTSDIWITAKVKTELLADSLSKNFDMEVTTVNGIVSLNGKVKNSESIMLAQGIANSVDGVKDVNVSGLTLEETKSY